MFDKRWKWGRPNLIASRAAWVVYPRHGALSTIWHCFIIIIVVVVVSSLSIYVTPALRMQVASCAITQSRRIHGLLLIQIPIITGDPICYYLCATSGVKSHCGQTVSVNDVHWCVVCVTSAHPRSAITSNGLAVFSVPRLRSVCARHVYFYFWSRAQHGCKAASDDGHVWENGWDFGRSIPPHGTIFSM